MSKYEPLWNWIQNNGADKFSLTFAEIEKIAGIPIDHSFLTYKKELTEYGYKVGKISMKEQKVMFEKIVEDGTQEDIKMMHLVYCDNAGKKGEKVLDKILAGTKTMVVRGAAGRKIPHSRVFEGERLYFMEKGSAEITATAVVKAVQNYVKLSDEEITKILADNQNKLNLSDKQKTRWHKKCLCLVEFENVEEIPPLAFEHQGNMDDWLIIEKIEDVVAGTSIPYNYEKSRF